MQVKELASVEELVREFVERIKETLEDYRETFGADPCEEFTLGYEYDKFGESIKFEMEYYKIEIVKSKSIVTIREKVLDEDLTAETGYEEYIFATTYYKEAKCDDDFTLSTLIGEIVRELC